MSHCTVHRPSPRCTIFRHTTRTATAVNSSRSYVAPRSTSTFSPDALSSFPKLCELIETDSAKHRYLFYDKLKTLNLDTPDNRRPRYSTLKTHPSQMKKSAVLMCFVTRSCIVPSPIRLLILLKQPKNAKLNSRYLYGGQPCFPGGTFDSKLDDTLLQTAIRETIEELGPVHGLEICNESFPEAVTGAGVFTVKTFIAMFESPTAVVSSSSLSSSLQQPPPSPPAAPFYQLQVNEIAHAFEIDFAHLLQGYDPNGRITYPGYGDFVGPMFNVTGLTCPTQLNPDPLNQSHVPLGIWGYTASIIERFCRTLEHELSSS